MMMMMMMIAEITVGTGMEIQQLSSVRRTKREQNNYIGSNFVQLTRQSSLTPAHECAPRPVAITSLKRPPVPVSAPEKGATPLITERRRNKTEKKKKNRRQRDRRQREEITKHVIKSIK